MQAVMQALLLPNITEVLPHISFECTVNGKDLLATVTHQEQCGGQTLYYVCFSDGHSDVYAAREAVVQDGFGRTRHLDAYEEAVYGDLPLLRLMPKGDGYACVPVQEKGGERFNVWVRKRDRFYSAFYNGVYQFTLCKLNDEWVVSSARGEGYVINLPLARFIKEHLDEHPF